MSREEKTTQEGSKTALMSREEKREQEGREETLNE